MELDPTALHLVLDPARLSEARRARVVCELTLPAKGLARTTRLSASSPPDRGARKGKQFLYPSEFTSVVGSEVIPLSWRRLIALAIYLAPRAGELEALSREIRSRNRAFSARRRLWSERRRWGCRLHRRSLEDRVFPPNPEVGASRAPDATWHGRRGAPESAKSLRRGRPCLTRSKEHIER